LGLRGTEVSINLIPHTVENTALGSLNTGSTVNLEIDTVARYVERMLRVDATLSDAAALKVQP
jgi:riboflavin synthase